MQWSPEDKLVKARIDFIHNDCVFLGNLALRLKLVDATEWCPTAATDFKHLYYNRDFIDRCSLDETKFVIAHEVMHCVYDHFTRRDERDPKLYNMAGDYVINLELQDLSIGSFPSSETMMDPKFEEFIKEHFPDRYRKYKKEFAGKPGVLCEEKYRDLSSEEVYDILKKEEEEKGDSGKSGHDMHIDPSDGDGDGEGDGDCETCGGTGVDPNDDGSGDEQDGQGGSGDGDGDAQDGQGGHSHGGGKPCPDCGGSGKDNSGKSGPIKISKEELDRLPDEIRKAVMDAAKVAESADGSAGNVPGGVKKLIDEWTDSRIDWREYLNSVVQSTLKSDYTWMRQSRKSMSTSYYLPAMDNDDMVSVDLAIDTSGSMGAQMLKDILGEVKGIMEQFADFRLRVWCFDTQTYKIYEYGPDTLDEIYEFELQGFGGTMFECNWEMMREQEIMPDQFILCTDGYPCGTWGEEDYCETVFLIHSGENITAPFGTTVHYEEAAQD